MYQEENQNPGIRFGFKSSLHHVLAELVLIKLLNFLNLYFLIYKTEMNYLPSRFIIQIKNNLYNMHTSYDSRRIDAHC